MLLQTKHIHTFHPVLIFLLHQLICSPSLLNFYHTFTKTHADSFWRNLLKIVWTRNTSPNPNHFKCQLHSIPSVSCYLMLDKLLKICWMEFKFLMDLKLLLWYETWKQKIVFKTEDRQVIYLSLLLWSDHYSFDIAFIKDFNSQYKLILPLFLNHYKLLSLMR